jgi:hypothetical protein
MQLTEAIRTYEGQPITRQILFSLLKDYKRPLDKITDLIRDGVLTQIKAKVYIPGPNLKMRAPEPYLLANHLASPSYVSMETALSHWRLIPERVYEVTSAIAGRSRHYATPAGRFRYTHVPLPYFSFGQISLQLAPGQVSLMATPEKALCDTVISIKGLLFRSPKAAKQWSLEDMRMDKTVLQSLNTAYLRDWYAAAPKTESLLQLIKFLEDL